MNFQRKDGRAYNQVRPISLKYDFFGYADASILYEAGNTKVLVSVSMQDGVPRFLKNKKVGWLSAEYAMLPCAGQRRNNREAVQGKRNSRSVEISRLIGRCLRTSIDLSNIGEKTIVVDCDVLKADGGTRVACITAASLALKLAEKRWLNSNIIEKKIIKDSIAAISVGKVDQYFLLDLDFIEDSNVDADFNFVLNNAGKLIEIQGTSEHKPLSWDDFEKLKELAINGINELFEKFKKYENNIKINNQNLKVFYNKEKIPFFSLENRFKKTL